MCDYSLMGVPNRLAREGEELLVCRFKTGSLGLTPASPAWNLPQTNRTVGRARRLLKVFGAELAALVTEPIAACIPPGARLVLRDIPKYIQDGCRVGPIEEVTFTQLAATPYEYRDAVRFHKGQEVLLQDLEAGQRVRVLQLSLEEEKSPHSETVEVFVPEHMPLDFVVPRSFVGNHSRRESRHE